MEKQLGNVSALLSDKLEFLRVLVVDDDEFVLEFVEDMLNSLGVKNVSRALDGNAALAAIDSAIRPPQLLICDLNMPGMDGIEFLRHLADRRFEGGVIISSGGDQRVIKTVESLVQAHKLRFLGTLQKPVDEGALLTTLINFTGAELDTSYGPILNLTPEEIRAGLKSDQVETFFQPKVTVADRRVVGAECLVRWRHPERGLIQPSAFISVAEEHGLIDGLTMEVFSKAMAHLGEWTRLGHDLKVSVNVSMDNLNRLDLPEVFADIARKAGVEPGRVILEMTESRLMSDIATSLEIITRLRLKGFGLSIDDFGTGYSSMEKLKQLPFTELKVDRTFVCGATSDDVARAILESSVQMGHALGMNVVAEGAETQEDWDLLAAIGCDEVQGYIAARPMAAAEFIAWKTRWDAGTR
jgi:EAL domain-containing protein (putative c-di-GMP-specific phosphodiesterase class I)/ActR/RegA family two-component response regulator